MKKNESKKSGKLLNIKSKYVLRIIFNNINFRRELKTIKYNKKLINLLEKSIDDFKNFFQIEIEIIPNKDAEGPFVNINRFQKNFFHIYFNNDRFESKCYKIEKSKKIKKIYIKIDNQNITFKGLFKEIKSIKKINIIKCNRKDFINLSYMFDNCKSLKELNIANFNTNNVINMEYMFNGCESLEELNLNNFNTKNVTNMRSMFNGCKSLKELNLSNFITINVIDMNSIFKDCSSLETLNIINFSTRWAEAKNNILTGCNSLNYLFCSDNAIKNQLK